jgi:hypothetical protein
MTGWFAPTETGVIAIACILLVLIPFLNPAHLKNALPMASKILDVRFSQALRASLRDLRDLLREDRIHQLPARRRPACDPRNGRLLQVAGRNRLHLPLT